MLSDRVFIDANIPLYASGTASPLREPCVAIMNAIGEGQLAAVIDVEVLQEIMHYARRRRQPDRGSTVARNLVSVVEILYPVEPPDAMRMIDLLEQLPHLDPRDAVHAAVMMRHGISRIITADRDFSGVPGLVALSPNEAADICLGEQPG